MIKKIKKINKLVCERDIPGDEVVDERVGIIRF